MTLRRERFVRRRKVEVWDRLLEAVFAAYDGDIPSADKGRDPNAIRASRTGQRDGKPRFPNRFAARRGEDGTGRSCGGVRASTTSQTSISGNAGTPKGLGWMVDTRRPWSCFPAAGGRRPAGRRIAGRDTIFRRRPGKERFVSNLVWTYIYLSEK